jgi:hypothetical protein
VRVRDGVDDRRKLAPDTRSEEAANWQLWDRKHQPEPAEYGIEVALAEGDIEMAGSAYAAESTAQERSWEYEFQGMETLAVTTPEADGQGAAEEDYSPDLGTHHSRNLRVDVQGRKHLLRLEFPQRQAVEGFREYGQERPRAREVRNSLREGNATRM